MKQEDWTERLRKQLAEYEDTVPADMWADIEARLAQQGASPRRSRIIPMWTRWVAAATFAALLTVGGYLLWKPEDASVSVIAKSELPVKSDKEGEPVEIVEPQRSVEIVEVQRPVGGSGRSDGSLVSPDPLVEQPSGVEEEQHTTVEESVKKQDEQEPVYHELEHNIEMPPKRQKDRRVSISMYAQNGFGNQTNANGVLMSPQLLAYYDYSRDMERAASRAEGPVYLANYEERQKHYQPVSFGLTANIPISSIVALSTGVVYTRLRSDFVNIVPGGMFQKEQTLHYIGIPLNMQFHLWRWHGLNVYLSGGAEVDFNVQTDMLADGVEQDMPKDRAQWSLQAAAGVQYDLVPRFGIYVEPGVKHYFDNGSCIQNFFKDKPTNFNLQLGLRVNLNGAKKN